MTTYIKVRLHSQSNGQFKGNGVIVKTADSKFVFIYAKEDFPSMSGNMTDPSNRVSFGDATFESARNIVAAVIRTGDAPDSFETCLIAERLRTDSVFANYRVRLNGTAFVADGVFSVDFDNLFEAERREAYATSGVLIKQAYTQTETYSGYGGYHSNHSRLFNTPLQNDKPYRIGVELEVYARSQSAYNTITGARTNWFQCERDGSLNQANFPIEIKTIPLRPCDATSVDFWAEPMKKLGELAKSKGYTSTGLHVHISKEILGDTERERQQNLSKLCTFYTYYVEDDPAAHEKNVIICGRQRGYGGDIGPTKTDIGEFAKKVGINKVAESDTAFAQMADGIKAGYQSQRWDINVNNWNSYGTIEFRKADGRISRTRMAAVCTWWEQMCLYCKETHPKDFSFDRFFEKVCREYPAVAYFFQADEEQ